MRSRRRASASRKLDLSTMRELLADGRVHTALGLVTDQDGSHYELFEGDLLVDCLLVPDEVPITARMAPAGGGGAGQGLWWVPAVGSEVALLVPDGELEAGALIVGVCSSEGVPEGVQPGRLVAAWPEILLGSGTAAEPFVLGTQLQSLLSDVLDALATHTHLDPVSGSTGVPSNAATYTAAKTSVDAGNQLSDKVKGE